MTKPTKPYYNDIKFLNALFQQHYDGRPFKMAITDLVSYRRHIYDLIADLTEYETVNDADDVDSVYYQTCHAFEFVRNKAGTDVPELEYRLLIDRIEKEMTLDSLEGILGLDVMEDMEDIPEGIMLEQTITTITYQQIYPPLKEDVFKLVVMDEYENLFYFVLNILLDAVNGVLYNGKDGAYEDSEDHVINLRGRQEVAQRKSLRERESAEES